MIKQRRENCGPNPKTSDELRAYINSVSDHGVEFRNSLAMDELAHNVASDGAVVWIRA
jgi:hypothetical protein